MRFYLVALDTAVTWQRWLWHFAYPSLAAAFYCIGTLGPLLGCFIAYRLQTGSWRAVRLWPRQKWRLVWLVGGPLLVWICFFGFFPAFVLSGDPHRWQVHIAALSGILIPMFNYNLFGGPLFEEFGWRGYLQTNL